VSRSGSTPHPPSCGAERESERREKGEENVCVCERVRRERASESERERGERECAGDRHRGRGQLLILHPAERKRRGESKRRERSEERSEREGEKRKEKRKEGRRQFHVVI